MHIHAVIVICLLLAAGAVLYYTYYAKNANIPESFAADDYTDAALWNLYTSTYASGCLSNSIGRNKIECFANAVFTKFARFNYIQDRGTTFFKYDDVIAMLTAVLGVIKKIHDGGSMDVDATQNYVKYNYAYISRFAKTPEYDNSVFIAILLQPYQEFVSSSILNIPDFVGTMMIFVSDNSCNVYSNLATAAQAAITTQKTQLSANTAYYKQACSANEINPRFAPPPPELANMSCAEIAAYVKNLQTENASGAREFTSSIIECQLCNYCQHPGDMSLCEAACGKPNQFLSENPNSTQIHSEDSGVQINSEDSGTQIYSETVGTPANSMVSAEDAPIVGNQSTSYAPLSDDATWTGMQMNSVAENTRNATTMATTYDNITFPDSTQITQQTQLARQYADMESGTYPMPTNYRGIGGGGGVMNVFAPNIMVNPIILQNSGDSMDLPR